MMVDPITPLIYLYFALAFAGVAVALWVVMLVASGGRGPRLPGSDGSPGSSARS